MTLRKAKQIRLIWDVTEETEPEISTERLLQLTADLCRCDIEDVVDALELTEREKNN